MADSETEAQTLERIEAALRKIAELAQAPKAANGARASGADAGRAEAGLPAIDRDALVKSLDLLISRLRTGLDPAKAQAAPE